MFRYAEGVSANTRFETLADVYRKDANLAVSCGCRHRAVIDGAWLSRYFMVRRWDGRLFTLGDRLRCSRCGGRPNRVRVTNAMPTIELRPRTEHEWRRLIRRLRS